MRRVAVIATLFGVIATFYLDARQLPEQAVGPSGLRWDDSSRLKSGTTAADLRRRADDASAAREKRAEVGFALFANYVKPPQGAAAVGKVLAEATWLKDTDLVGIYALGGKIPVEWTFEDTVFCLYLFPGK